MAAKRYQKYFIEYDPKQWDMPKMEGAEAPPFRIISRIDNHIAKGAYFYFVHWVMPGKMSGIGHPPHIHKDAELLFHIGSNPEDPMDLGAEVEMYMGEEMERYTFTRSTCIYIPPNFIHCPWKPTTYKPWIFIEVNQGPVHTEKSYHHLLPKADREKYAAQLARFKDEGF